MLGGRDLEGLADLRLHVDGEGDEPLTRRGDVTGLGHRCYSRQQHPTSLIAQTCLHVISQGGICCQDHMTTCSHMRMTTTGEARWSWKATRARRGLAITAGITAIAAGAALNVTHLVEGGQPLFSPMTGAILALALGAVAAALVASEAWRSGRRTLASCLVLSIVAGEGFGLIMGAERLLSAREERQRAASEVNTARWIATVRVESASSTLAATEAAVLKEAGRGGCKGACQALQAEAEQARQRLEAANRPW